VFNLKTMKLLAVQQVGDDPDVLAFDPGLKRLYVSAESGNVSVFQERDGAVRLLGQFDMPHAHTVAVDAEVWVAQMIYGADKINSRSSESR
jgi:DNA-binding beta-propeller fold protein YncE